MPKEDFIKKEDHVALLKDIDTKVNILNDNALRINQLIAQTEQLNARYTRQQEESKLLGSEVLQFKVMNQDLKEKVEHYKYSSEKAKEKC